MKKSFVCLLLILGLGMSERAWALESFEKDSLIIETKAGAAYPFTIELALNDPQRAQGLMYRQEMAADHGMLFIYDWPRMITMWMKNTFIPLDMIFVDAEGVIVDIAERTIPQSLEVVGSDQPAVAVLEVNSGTVSRLKISRGDRVRYKAFAK